MQNYKTAKRSLGEYLFRYRYAAAILLWGLCILLRLTGSSIGCWTACLGEPDNDLLFGVSRPIRSDEWAVFTPMLWSQYRGAEAFPYFSSVVRGCATDVFAEYGQPVYSVLMLFRLFHLGYLFLPLSFGMAFFWCGRLIGLFMSSFEFGRLITDDRRGLSVLYALCVTLAPAVQWWFAINGLVEMLICSQAAVVLLRSFLRTESFKKRIAAALGITVCAGNYILTVYPAWQVTVFYVLVGCSLWILLENYKHCSMHCADWLLIGSCVLFLAGLLGVFLYKSRDMIQIMMNTVYPGKRVNTGGDAGRVFFEYVADIWLGLKGEAPYFNTCELAKFMDLFPLCWILPVLAMRRRERKDRLLILLLCVSLGLFIYIRFGIPAPVARLTLLSMSVPNRAMIAFGFCNLILLFRSLALLLAAEKKVPIISALVIGGMTACFAVWEMYRNAEGYFSRWMLAATLLLFGILNCGSLLIQRRSIRGLFCAALVGTMLVSGATVNPVRSGLDSVVSIPIIERLNGYSKQDTLWVIEQETFPYTNLTLLAGLPTVNSTNVYPDLDRWHMFDPDGRYEDIYNRYAHITVHLVEDTDQRETFEMGVSADQFTVNLTTEDLRKLGVTHVLTTRDLSAYGLQYEDEVGSGFRVYTVGTAE